MLFGGMSLVVQKAWEGSPYCAVCCTGVAGQTRSGNCTFLYTVLCCDGGLINGVSTLIKKKSFSFGVLLLRVYMDLHAFGFSNVCL